MTKTSSM